MVQRFLRCGQDDAGIVRWLASATDEKSVQLRCRRKAFAFLLDKKVSYR